MKSKLIYWTFLLLLSTFSPLAAQENPRENSVEGSLSTKLRFAATQHEIVSILIQEGAFDRILSEYKKILDLDLGRENEKLVVESAWLFADQLMALKRFELAHEIVDQTLKKTQLDENRFTLLMLKGKVFKQEGRFAEALETYRRAQDLQR